MKEPLGLAGLVTRLFVTLGVLHYATTTTLTLQGYPDVVDKLPSFPYLCVPPVILIVASVLKDLSSAVASKIVSAEQAKAAEVEAK